MGRRRRIDRRAASDRVTVCTLNIVRLTYDEIRAETYGETEFFFFIHSIRRDRGPGRKLVSLATLHASRRRIYKIQSNSIGICVFFRSTRRAVHLLVRDVKQWSSLNFKLGWGELNFSYCVFIDMNFYKRF